VKLQELKSFLTKLKENVNMGIKRVEVVMGSLEVGGLNLGSGVGQNMGHDKVASYTESKPKRKNRKRKNKNKKIQSGPKPGISQARGDVGAMFTRHAVEMRSFQVGETFEAGATRVTGASRTTSSLSSILGKYEWICKTVAPTSLSVMGLADQG
jgi:hypothetical protein